MNQRARLRTTALAATLAIVGLALAVPPEDRPPFGDDRPPFAGDGPPDAPSLPGPPPPGPQPPGGPLLPAPTFCAAGETPLAPAEVNDLLLAAAAALASDFTVAVVDRAGNILGLFRKDPGSASFDDPAVGLARTAAFFSNGQAPLSSRTVRFVSGVHFPPGVARTPNAALYGIENTNRGCDLDVGFNPGKAVPPARSVNGAICQAGTTAGCGTGPLTGKPNLFDDHPPALASANHRPAAVAVDPGGLPIYRGRFLVGGIGAAGPALPPGHAEFAALSALAGNSLGLTLTPVPLPPPGVVFIDGIRLPLVKQTSRPPGAGPQSGPLPGAFLVAPLPGFCVPDGYLVGPLGAATLSAARVDQIVQQAVAAAGRTRAVIRLPLGSKTRMVIAVADTHGKVLAIHRMPDATVFSIDVAVAKARNVVHFSTAGLPGVPPGTAVTNRTIGFGAQPLYPPGIDGTAPGPFFSLFQSDAANPCSQGGQAGNPDQNGIVFFAGSVPLYDGTQLVGGLGVSGDGVEQDDYVTFFGAQGFLPPESIRADRVFIRGVRLPFLKFPRNPEG